MILRLALVSLAILVGCAPNHEVMDDQIDEKVRALLLKPEEVDFLSVRKFVFAPSCLQCHSSVNPKDGVDLSEYASVLRGVGDRKLVIPYDAGKSSLYLVLSAIGKRQMPPVGHPALSESQRNLVFTWIENGTKPSAGAAPARPPSLKEQLAPYFQNPETIDYSVVRKFVLAQSCERCHSLNSPSKDLNAITYSANLTDYDSLFNPFTPVVAKGNPLESKLFKSIALAQSMPPSKDGYEPLDGLRLRLVRLWILNCAVSSIPEADELNRNPDNPDKVRGCEL